MLSFRRVSRGEPCFRHCDFAASWSLGFVLSLAAAVAPIVSSTPAGAASTIKVGLLADNTGVYSAVFAGVTTGMEAELKQVNAAGGVNGHKISYTVLDTQSSPTQAVAVAKAGSARREPGTSRRFAVCLLRPSVSQAAEHSDGGMGGQSRMERQEHVRVRREYREQGRAVGRHGRHNEVHQAKGFTKIAVLADSSAGSSTAGKDELRAGEVTRPECRLFEYCRSGVRRRPFASAAGGAEGAAVRCPVHPFLHGGELTADPGHTPNWERR